MKCPNCGANFLPIKETKDTTFRIVKGKKKENGSLESLDSLKTVEKLKVKQKNTKQVCKNCGILLNTTEQPNLVNLKEVTVSLVQPEHRKDGKKDPSLGRKRR